MAFEEADRLLDALDRRMEYDAEMAAAKTESEKYWAGSASASIMRDYRAGRVISKRAGK